MTRDRFYQASMALVIIIGIVGVPLAFQAGCQDLYVRDAETGEVRPATPAEELQIHAKVITETADQVSYIMAVTGHPEYIPFAQLGGQLALALTALFINKKRNGLPAPKKK